MSIPWASNLFSSLSRTGTGRAPGFFMMTKPDCRRRDQAALRNQAFDLGGRNNHAVRGDRWRYIRYEDGFEELYDHQSDPHEYKNLAALAGHEKIKQDMIDWLPKVNAPDVGPKKRS